MDNPALTLSIIALVFSTTVLSFQLILLIFRLDIRIADIIPSTTHEEDSPMFLVRLVIVNRASVGRTVCGIKLVLPKKYRKVCSIEPTLHQYSLSDQSEISAVASPVTIDAKTKSLGDSIFQLPLDISPGQSTIRWLALKVSRKCPPQQDYGNIQCQLALLNVREGILGKTDVTLPTNFLSEHVQTD